MAHALTRYHQPSNDRGDEQHLHVADLGKCPREVWARRNGVALMPFPMETRRKFRVGIDLEREVLDAIEQAYAQDYTLHRGVLCWLDLDEKGELIGGIAEDDLQPTIDDIFNAHPHAVIGHPDGLLVPKGVAERTPPAGQAGAAGVHVTLPTVVVEVKSTLFYERTMADGTKARVADEAPPQQHVIQTSGYGLACRADVCLITTSCIQSGRLSPESPNYRYHPERDRGLLTLLVSKYQRLTAIGAPMPPSQPPEFSRRMRPRPNQAASWMCDYCRLATCEKNNNPSRLEVAL